MAARSNPDNWDSYLEAFRRHFRTLNATDPQLFPRDDRFWRGAWQSFTALLITGKFQCMRGRCGRSWRSGQVQVDLEFRYNFGSSRGEVRIVREWRQTCHHCSPDPGRGETPVNTALSQYLFPLLGETGGADRVMEKLKKKIEEIYYYKEHSAEENSAGENNAGRRPRLLLVVPPDHRRENCEACEAWRCPKPRLVRPRLGRTSFNETNIQYLDWVLFDENNHPFPLM